MEPALFMGMLVIAIPTLIGVYKFIDEKAVKRTEATNKIREQQIEATHQQTLATIELTNEMKTMRKEVSDIERRTHNLEVVVFKKDRTY